MTRTPSTTTRRRLTLATVDVLILLAISFVAQATHFSYQRGRAVLSGDSAQYVSSAEALLDPVKTPHFEMRKPGYILFLASIHLSVGNMGWAAIAANHFLLALTPLAAYGLGCQLRGRGLGWLAAVLVIVRLQGEVYADRVMSEALYVFLLSFGLLIYAVAISKRGSVPWMIFAGIMLGLAWLTRSAAAPIIIAALLVCAVLLRRDRKTALASCTCLAAPILALFLFECGLNLHYAGQFRPSNGTAGPTLLLRARNFEGFDWPDTTTTREVLALLPERETDDAYAANLLDVWVAPYHAVHDRGMDECQYDTLMRRAGLEGSQANFKTYLRSSLHMTLQHLLRRPDGQALSPIPKRRLAGPVLHPAACHDADAATYWFAYWGLPHLSLPESIALVDRMKTTYAQKAPFGASAPWKALRYWKTRPFAADVLSALTWLSRLWPGFALLALLPLGLDRRICALLATAYLLDALFIGFLTPTTARIQFTSIVPDSTLAAAPPAGALGLFYAAYARIRSRVIRRDAAPHRPGQTASATTRTS